MQNSLAKILSCPRCQAIPAEGLNIGSAHCQRCGVRFFDLDGVPCWFPAGVVQRQLWDDLLAKFINYSADTKRHYSDELARINLLPKVRQRLCAMQKLRTDNHQTIISLLKQAGLTPKQEPRFEGYEPTAFAQYFELTLRDWAWHPLEGSDQAGYRHYADENEQALQAVLKVAKSHLPGGLENALVLGSGAGRLSWDLHCELQFGSTIAFDQNPLLIYLSKIMVRDKETVNFLDARKLPRYGQLDLHQWALQSPPGADSQRENWHAFAGDAWALPFVEHSFDVVVTPWFIDITGRDVRDIIEVVARMLKPGGYWLNYGPLLYSDALPESQLYTFDELRELLSVAQFELRGEGFTTAPYTYSPLNERGRIEDLWTFLAQSPSDLGYLKDAGECSDPLYKDNPPAWLVMPHLPVPRLVLTDSPSWMDNIIQLMDGRRSINDIAEIVAPNLPEGHDPHQFMYDFFDQHILQDRTS